MELVNVCFCVVCLRFVFASLVKTRLYQWVLIECFESHDLTADILVSLNNGTVAMLVCTQLILQELSSIIMQTFSFVSVEKQGY